MTTRRIPRWADPLLFVALIGAVVRFTLGLSRAVRVELGDETLYMAAGLHPGTVAHPIAQSSPLYGIWYRALSVVEPAPQRLYVLNWFVLTASLPLVLFLLVRRSGGPRWAATFACLAWTVSGVSMVWPSGAKLATLIVALGALLATSFADRYPQSAVAALTVVVASGVRPELAPAGIVLCLGVAVWGLRTSRGDRRRLASVVAITAVAAVSTLTLPRTFIDGRTLSAFEQHYALNVADAQDASGDGDAHDPWNDGDSNAIADFRNAESVSQAARKNPAAFAWHVTQNLRKLPAMSLVVLSPCKQLGTWVRAPGLGIVWALVLGGALGLSRVVRRRRLGFSWRAPAWALLVVVVVVAGAASVILIHPREHYVVAPLFFSFALLATASAHLPPFRVVRRASAQRMTALAVAVTVAPLASAMSFPRPADDGVPARRFERTVATIKSLGLHGEVRVLESRLGHLVYVGLPSRSVELADRADGERLWDFLAARRIELVVVDGLMRAHSRFRLDLRNDADVAVAARAHGFAVVPVVGTHTILLVRRGT